MNRFVRLVLIGSVVLSACGGGSIGNGGTTGAPTGQGDDGANGPEFARKIDGEVYPGETSIFGGLVRQFDNGCWWVSSPEGDESMVVWPSGSQPSDDGLAVRWSDSEVRSGWIMQGMARQVPVVKLAGIDDGYWGSVTGFCGEDETVIVFDDVTALVNADTSFDLSASYPCGIGFTAAGLDQSVALVLRVRDASDPDLNGRVTFPDQNWLGELIVGHNLMANWCNDAIEEGAPVPIIHASFPVVAGSLSFDGPPSDGSRCEPNPVIATASGLMVDWTGETQVALEDLIITNEAFGCFAG